MGEVIDNLVENLEKAGLGHKISQSEIKLRNCNDVQNFLKRKQYIEKISRKINRVFRADYSANPAYN